MANSNQRPAGMSSREYNAQQAGQPMPYDTSLKVDPKSVYSAGNISSALDKGTYSNPSAYRDQLAKRYNLSGLATNATNAMNSLNTFDLNQMKGQAAIKAQNGLGLVPMGRQGAVAAENAAIQRGGMVNAATAANTALANNRELYNGDMGFYDKYNPTQMKLNELGIKEKEAGIANINSEIAARNSTASEGSVLANAQNNLMASRGTDGNVDPQVYLAERNKFVTSVQGANPAQFDAYYAGLLHPDEQQNLGISTTATRGINMSNPEDIEGMAQMLVSGDITPSQLSKRTTNYNAVLTRAKELDSTFNPAAADLGYQVAKNPKIRQQISALDNVQSRVDDLLSLSDAAGRSDVTWLNKFINPVSYGVGQQNFTNFHNAATAFADELSGALGFGNATDMSRQMGINLTDPNLSPANFRSDMNNVILPFIKSKRASITNQFGQYGDAINSMSNQSTNDQGLSDEQAYQLYLQQFNQK